MAQFPHLEFHRLGVGLALASAEGQSPPFALLTVPDGPDGRPVRSCSCKGSRGKTCDHLKELSQAYRELQKAHGEKRWTQRFSASRWYRLAQLLFQGEAQAAAGVEAATLRSESGSVVRITKPAGQVSAGQVLAEYLDDSPVRQRFLERVYKAPADGVPRAQLLDRLALVQASQEERYFAKVGMKLGRQVWEESFWHRLAYHAFRELGDSGLRFEPVVDLTTGDFRLAVLAGAKRKAKAGAEEKALMRLTVPRDRVQAALKFLVAEYPKQASLQIHPVPLKSLFRITAETELDLQVQPVIRWLQESGEERFFARQELERFLYGSWVYVPELKVLAELEQPGRERRFKAPVSMKLRRSQVPSFLQEHSAAVEAGEVIVDPALGKAEVFRDFDRIEIASGVLAEGGYQLDAHYTIGAHAVPWRDVLDGISAGRPFLEVGEGWMDLQAPPFALLGELARWRGAKEEAPETEDGPVRLTASGLLRLRASGGRPVEVLPEAEGKPLLDRLLELRPAEPYRQAAGFRSQLRPYQVLGVDWLRWLWDNRLGGLLADDMGLGKTHQAMALMTCLVEQKQATGATLVICPTSVISHWRKQISKFAPGLKTRIFHGPQRALPAKLKTGTVILTSYGVLRRDEELLASKVFSLVVFDEIQHLKNRGTVGYQVAARLQAAVKIGMTGTPVENSLEDLKALFDLLLPDYLGTTARFAARFHAPRTGGGAALRQEVEELRRTIAPFILRRRKEAVLEELPPKFEEERTCRLSEDQLRLYRAAAEEKGRGLIEKLRQSGEPVPYIHVFALLNYLKRVCDHPALALNDLERAAEYRSGKWELFCELLEEALDSGHKVVVFSQYLGMITLMTRHLEALGVGHEVLTGASRKRGGKIDRFNEDPDCRVFLGSLKAGGTGIDLIGGSVVLHYDRWWNAAREDQATDRVYRMGQKRAVHVVKLVAEGTLEEKIAAIIDAKRQLMEDLVQEDDPTLAKVFTREELLELLAPV